MGQKLTSTVLVLITAAFAVLGVVGTGTPAAALAPCPPGAPPRSSLCSPQGFAVMAEFSGTGGMAARGAVAASNTTVANVTTAARGTSLGPQLWTNLAGVLGISVGVAATWPDGEEGIPTSPYVQPGWEGGTNVWTETASNRPGWSLAATVVSAPEYGETGTVVLHVTQVGRWDPDNCYRSRYPFMTAERVGSRFNVDFRHVSGPHPTQLCEGAIGPAVYAADAISLDYVNFGGLSWRPHGYEDRPEGEVGGARGVVEQLLHCRSASGVTEHLNSFTVEGMEWDLPDFNCPPGTVLDSYSVVFTDRDTGEKTTLWEDTSPDHVRDMPVEFPNCFDGVAARCSVELWHVPSGGQETWCGHHAVGCQSWWVDPNKNDNYQCRYGGYTVDLGRCSLYRKPGEVSANVTTFEDPLGLRVPDAGPRVVLEPDAYDDLEPQPEPEPGQDPDPDRPIKPEPVPPEPPKPPNQPEPVPPVPPVDPVDPDEPVTGECFPTGWGIFNPVEWVYKPVQCALRWAFVPRASVVQSELTRGSGALEDHGVLSLLPAAAQVPGHVTDGFSGGCSGGLMSIDVSTGYGDLEAGLPCSPGDVAPSIGTAYSGFYTFMTVVIGVGTAWGAFITVRGYFGGKDS